MEGMPRRERAEPKPDEPAPDPARDTIDELQRARARAQSGTPEPESTPRGLNGAEYGMFSGGFPVRTSVSVG